MKALIADETCFDGDPAPSQAGGSRSHSSNSCRSTSSASQRSSGSRSHTSGAKRSGHGKSKRDPAQRRAFMKSHPCPSTGKSHGACPGYVVDHVVPLKRGGADSPSNM